MKIDVFETGPMEAYASMITKQLGVHVIMKGREIKASFDPPPPKIFLPNMENAPKEAVEVLFGFCLHEAGHIKYTNFKVHEQIKDYLTFNIYNAFEDERIERKLENDFPGGRETLKYSYLHGKEIFFKDKDKVADPLDQKSMLDDLKAGRKAIKEELEELMKSRGIAASERDKVIRATKLDPDDKELQKLYANRMEVLRVSLLWLLSKRRYFDDLKDWLTHPWKPVFDEVTAIPARNTQQALDQAKALLERLGLAIKVPPRDKRPIDEAKDAVKKALEKMSDARKALADSEGMEREREHVADERVEKSGSNQELVEARNARMEAKETADESRHELKKHKKKLREAKESAKITKDRLDAERKELRELHKAEGQAETEAEKAETEAEAEEAEEPEEENDETEAGAGAEPPDSGTTSEAPALPAPADGTADPGTTPAPERPRAEVLDERIKNDEALLARKQALVEEEKKAKEAAETVSLADKAKETEARAKEDEKRADFEKESAEISKETEKEYRPKIDSLKKTAERAEKTSQEFVARANAITGKIKERDAECEEQIAVGVLEYLVEKKFDEFRNEGIEDEMGDTDASAYINEVLVDCKARKYCPYDRSQDRVDVIAGNSRSKKQYEEVRAKYKKIIEETADKLRRLYSPEKNRVKIGATQGRLDPRQVVRVRLAQMGHPIDLTRIWKDVDPKRDPKVAVSLLLDCFGSMLGCDCGEDDESDAKLKKGEMNPNSRLHLACAAATCLSEVMQQLGIPHEIIGHTSYDEGLEQIKFTEEDLQYFSRFIPFQGYMFKSFDDKEPPTGMFTLREGDEERDSRPGQCLDNIDGEAVLWAVNRLASRPERTKILIVASDGLPCADTCIIPELERHLLTVCRAVEQREKDGLFLFGIGIGDDRVANFYRNSSVLKDTTDLPKSVLGIVEHVLCNLVGSLG